MLQTAQFKWHCASIRIGTSIVYANSQGPLNSSYTKSFNYSPSVSIVFAQSMVSSTLSQIIFLQCFIADSIDSRVTHSTIYADSMVITKLMNAILLNPRGISTILRRSTP